MKRLITGLMIAILFTGCGMITQERVIDARKDIQDRDYKSAISILEKIEDKVKDMTPDQKGEYYILKAQALKELERYEEAKNALNLIININPGSVFEAQAKLLLEKWKVYF